MFDSGITVESLIDDLNDEADVEYPISDKMWVDWLNQLEYLLYSEIVRENRKCTVVYSNGDITLPTFQSGNEADVEAGDVLSVFSDDIQLIQINEASSDIFPDCWYVHGNGIRYSTEYTPVSMSITYTARPKLHEITIDGTATAISGNVNVPIGFIDMVKAKLRGEAYKIANEDALAAKWLNDYNALLENFKMFVAERQASFGL